MTYRRSMDAIHDRIVARLKAQPSEPQRVECAWCQTEMSPGREPTSHGICDLCERDWRADAGLDPE